MLYVPSISRNIISVARLKQSGFTFCFNDDCIQAYKAGIFYFQARPQNGIYEVNLDNSLNDNSMFLTSTKRAKHDLDSSYLWHCRLAHINKKRISQLQKSGLLKTNENVSFDICESCLSGKMTKAPFLGSSERAKDLLGMIHTDVCGPFRTATMNGERFFITFTDDYSRYGYVYLLIHKHEAFEIFKLFQSEVENQLNKKIKILRSDRGGEYLSDEFKNHLESCGIISQLTPPGTPQLNGVSERRNRTLLDMVRSMMNQSSLHLYFWGYALMTAVRILNMAPTKKVDKTPYEIWHGKVSSFSYLRIWGCEAYVKTDASNKLHPRSTKCIFVGYPKNSLGYYFYDPNEDKVFIARHAEFLESKFLNAEISGRQVDLYEEPSVNAQEVGTSNSQVVGNELEKPSVRRSDKIRFEPERYGYNISSSISYDECCLLISSDEPENYQQAIKDLEANHWLEAMNTEMQSMHDNQVWELVDLPPKGKTVGCKWVYKKKTDMDGNLHTFKARLVAKGYTQTQGIDYEETFSPVVNIKSLRILIAIAAYYDYEIWQMDVKTAFLNGHLLEDLYMDQPEGFVNQKYPNKVCKLRRSIYGLKQASRTWNHRFNEEIKRFGFIKNQDEPCVFKKASGSPITFLVLYVDDILLFGNDIASLKETKAYLEKCFSMKDLGEATYILGIKIYRDRKQRLIGLSQSTYIDKVLKRFKMEKCNGKLTPLAVGTILDNSQCPSTDIDIKRMKTVPYASAIGSIMYAMVCTRPDVAYALSMTSRYQQNPGEGHWTAVKNILKYLKRTKDLFLVYGGQEELRVKCYTDASLQTDRDDCKSQSGNVFVLNGGAIAWGSGKQSVVAQSSTESEYIAASDAAREAAWIKKYVDDLGVVPTIQDPLVIICDNESTIAIANDAMSQKRTRHIHRRFNYIRDEVERGEFDIRKVHTDQNVADPFTKPLLSTEHENHARAIGLRYSRDWM